MADNSGKTNKDQKTIGYPFNWDEFNGILDGLATDPNQSPIPLQESPDGAAGDDPVVEAGEEAVAAAPRMLPPEPAVPIVDPVETQRPDMQPPEMQTPEMQQSEPLPRVHPQELVYHKAKARRRRVLVRRSGPPADRGISPDHHELSEQQRAEYLAARLAPNRQSPADTPADAAPQGRADRNAPVGPSAFDRALENEMRDLADLPRLPDVQGARHRDTAYASPLAHSRAADAQPDNPAPHQPHGEIAGDRGRIVIFGAIAVVALMLSGVSAVALFSGSGVDISSMIARSPATDSRSTIATVRTSKRPRSTGSVTLKPILSPVNQAAAVEPLVPRSVTTTRVNSTIESESHPAAIATVQPVIGTTAPVPRRQTVALAYALPNKTRLQGEPATQTLSDANDLPPEADPAPAEADFRILSPIGGEPLDEEARKRRAQLDALLERGRQIMETGDVASARLFYERVYEAGDPRGALAVASTYDPDTLRTFNVIGLAANGKLYRLWSKRAEDLANRTGARFVFSRN